jgi:TPR repeat protein
MRIDVPRARKWHLLTKHAVTTTTMHRHALALAYAICRVTVSRRTTGVPSRAGRVPAIWEDAHGCNVAGAHYEEGPGADRNPKRAARLYDKSCKAGVATGCVKFGALYLSERAGTKT